MVTVRQQEFCGGAVHVWNEGDLDGKVADGLVCECGTYEMREGVPCVTQAAIERRKAARAADAKERT